MDDSASSDSWNKMVISNTNNHNQWATNIKSERIDDDESAASTTGFCLDYDPFNDEKSDPIPTDNDAYLNIVPSISLQTVEKKKHQDEGPGQRAQRLAKMSAYAAQRLANESPEQRAVRLKRMSEYAAKRLANETSEQRAKRLSRMSAYAAKRLAKETPEQRQERLTRMSAYAAKRHAMRKMCLNPDTPVIKRRKTRSLGISVDDSGANGTSN